MRLLPQLPMTQVLRILTSNACLLRRMLSRRSILFLQCAHRGYPSWRSCQAVPTASNGETSGSRARAPSVCSPGVGAIAVLVLSRYEHYAGTRTTRKDAGLWQAATDARC